MRIIDFFDLGGHGGYRECSTITCLATQALSPRIRDVSMTRICGWLRISRKLTPAVILASACLILPMGCISQGRLGERNRLILHPAHESRMSSYPAEGYLPSGVWRIRGVQNTIYLAGTSHDIKEDQIPFPSPYYAAYESAQELYVEMDTTRGSFFRDLGLLFKMVKWMISHRSELICPEGQTLSDYLSAETMERLRAFYGKDFKGDRSTPVSLLLMNELGSSEDGGVDETFTLLAHEDGKRIRELDDGTITRTGIMMMDELLAKWRRDIARRGGDAVIAENILDQKEDDATWRRGDLGAVERDQAEMKTNLPLTYQKGIVERNRKWIPKLKLALQGKKNVMVLAGVDHLGGKDGLLEMLRAAGFNAEQMYGVDRPIPSGRSRKSAEGQSEDCCLIHRSNQYEHNANFVLPKMSKIRSDPPIIAPAVPKN